MGWAIVPNDPNDCIKLALRVKPRSVPGDACERPQRDSRDTRVTSRLWLIRPQSFPGRQPARIYSDSHDAVCPRGGWSLRRSDSARRSG